MRRFRHTPSPAIAISCLALVVALGGTSYAALSLPANSVGAKQLRAGSITAVKVRAHSLTASAFKNGQLPAGARGLPGPAGPPATRLFATVLPNGAGGGAATIGPSSGLVDNGVAVQASPLGTYTLRFAQDVSSCAVVASPGGRLGAAPLTDGVAATASTIGGGAVRVQTFRADAPDTIDAFTVAVFC